MATTRTHPLSPETSTPTAGGTGVNLSGYNGHIFYYPSNSTSTYRYSSGSWTSQTSFPIANHYGTRAGGVFTYNSNKYWGIIAGFIAAPTNAATTNDWYAQIS